MPETTTTKPAAVTAAKVPATAGSTRKPTLMVQTETYVNALTTSLSDMSIDFSNYQKICVINLLQKMKEMLNKEGLDFKSMNQDNISQILQMVSMLQLNIAATPRECYLQFRNWKDKSGAWHKDFEFGIEGDGNDKILRTFGVDVADVKGPYIVREGDDFTYPAFDGEKMVPPTWTPKSYYKKPLKVFYLVTKVDGSKEYLISERESVVKNLQAHIMNNMMKESDEAKNDMIKHIADMELDALIEDSKARPFISPAWFNPQSRNDMIIRKMKNNATKKYPKDFKNAFVESAYENTFEDNDQYKQPATPVDPTMVVAEEYDATAGTTPVETPILETSANSTPEAQTSVSEPVNANVPPKATTAVPDLPY